MNRTLLAFAVLIPLAIPTALAIETLGLQGWTATLAMLPAMVIASLFDREGFYGPRDQY